MRVSTMTHLCFRISTKMGGTAAKSLFNNWRIAIKTKRGHTSCKTCERNDSPVCRQRRCLTVEIPIVVHLKPKWFYSPRAQQSRYDERKRNHVSMSHDFNQRTEPLCPGHICPGGRE